MKKPDWNGDQACRVIPWIREYSTIPPPSSVIDCSSPAMFAATPCATIGAWVIDSCTWLATIGCRTAVRSRSICRGVWLETPNARTFPAASSSSNARATSSGSTRASGRWSRRMSM